MRIFRACSASMAILTLAMNIGCSKESVAPVAEAPEPDAVVEEMPASFPITATEVVVAEKEIPEVSLGKRVEADFNQDNLDDIAVVEEDTSGKSSVSIYLQKKGSDNLNRAYYKAGGIRLSGEFKITALMSRSKADYTDLMVIQLHNDGRKERVFFRTKGTEFTEVERVAVN